MIQRRIALQTGLTYNVCEWGSRDADTTFVLVHGFSDLGMGWEPVAELLARSAHVIAPDLRGHGDSDWIGAGGYYHFLDYVVDLDEVIERCATGKIILVGHSMGGSVSGYYAGARPERLHGLALLEGLGPPDLAQVDPATRTAGWIDAWRAARSKPGFRVMASLEVAVARLKKNDHLLDDASARRMAEVGTRVVDGGVTWKHDPLHMTQGPYLFRLDTAVKFWSRVTCPVVILDGEDSRLNLSIAERAARRARFANHRHATVPRAGHALHRHQPAIVAEHLASLR